MTDSFYEVSRFMSVREKMALNMKCWFLVVSSVSQASMSPYSLSFDRCLMDLELRTLQSEPFESV